MEQPTDGTGRFFVVGQDGVVSVVGGDNGKSSHDFLNIADRKPHTSTEDGLLGLAFHPGFKTNNLFYVYYTQFNPRRSVISEFKVSAADADAADLKSERIVLEVPQPFENHKAGQIRFGRDGFLYIALGDGGRGNDPFNNAQNTAVLLGKILRIDVNSRSTRTEAGKQNGPSLTAFPPTIPSSTRPAIIRIRRPAC